MTSPGDCGPYSADDWADMWRTMFIEDPATQGIISGFANELEPTGAVSPVQVDTGAAMVDGHYYYNSAAVNVVIDTPTVDTRIDRIVLRANYTAQTVRITLVAGIEGGAAPALTQVDGVTWDIPICQISITVGGAITITDERYFLVSQFSSKLRTTRLPLREAIPLFSGITASAREAVESSDAGTVKLVDFHIIFQNSSDNGVVWPDIELEYSFSTLSIKIRGTMDAANVSKNIVLVVQVAAVSDGDASVSAKAFDVANTFTIAVPDNADEEFVETLVLSDIDGAVYGDIAWFAIWRDFDHANDDASGNMLMNASPRLIYSS